jgi:glycerophosphoryl diester phosphodiesterase
MTETTPEGIAIRHGDHLTMLKWHRGRRRREDVAFTAARILEGLRLGASVEVDIVRHGSGGFAVLHDEILDDETSGTGRVAETAPEDLRRLLLRDQAGAISVHPVLLLEDLCAVLDRETLPETALLQLDLKEDDASLTLADLAAFRAACGPLARHLIVSGGDAAAVQRLAEGVEEIRVGFDPCYGAFLARLRETGDFATFATSAIHAMPQAAMIYLDYRLILAADAKGFDLVAPFHAAGKPVDAWTLNADHPDYLSIIRRLLELRVDQITTDDPVLMDRAARSLT